MFQIKGRTAYVELLMAAAAMGFGGSAFAENPARNTDTSRNPDVSRDADITRDATIARAVSGVDLQCGQKLIGMDVKDTQGEKIGTIKELVLDSTQDRVDYAVLSHGGAAGIGAKNIAIPWSEFRVTSAARDTGAAPTDEGADYKARKDHYLSLNVSKDAFKDVKGFSGDNFPQQVSSNWQQEQMAEQPATERSAADKEAFNARRISKLLGSEVRSGRETAAGGQAEQPTAQEQTQARDMEAMGEKVGEIKDAIIKSDNGQLAYAFIKLDNNVEGHGGDLSTVPWSALMIHREPKLHAMLQGPKATLGQFAFENNQQEEQLARLAERDYSRQIFMAYDQGPQWEALGFVSPGQPEAQPRQPGQQRNPNAPGQPGAGTQ